MKIRIKILLGYVLLALLVVLVGGVGYQATNYIGRQFDDAINRTHPVLQALQDIRFMTVKLLSHAHGHTNPTLKREDVDGTEDPNHHYADVGQLDAATARYLALVRTYFPEEAEQSAEIAEKVETFQAGIEKVQDGALPFIVQQRLLGRLSTLAGELLQAIEAASAHEREEFVEYQQGVKRELARQKWVIAGVALLAFMIAILSGAKISGRIAQPVIALRDAARRLGSGRLDTRVDVMDTTEVADLAEAFNSMAEQLAGSMVSREYVEDIIDSMAEGVIVVDANGCIQRVNHALVALFRCHDGAAFAGRALGDYFPDADVLDYRFGTPATRRWIETEIRPGDGEALTVALSVAGLHSGNAAPGAVVLVQDITERKRSEARLTYLARYDALTGLPNRTLLMDHLCQALTRLPWKTAHAAILFCDLDRFKFVNDTLGHGVGDLLLQRVAERLQLCVRPGDVVARWSGDEFVVLLNEVAQPSDIEPVVREVVTQLCQPIQIGPHELYVTVSVGISVAPAHASLAEELVKCADMAMYAAKAEGKNTYRFYAAGMAERSQERMQLERALRRALQEGGQLQVHYQPQQRIDGPLIGFEALVRWHHPELGLIAPANFLPAAEEAGLMAGIDEAVLRMACEQARQWQEQGIGGLRIAVNVSDHLFRRGDLPALLGRLLDEHALPPSAIELELTEAIVMSDIESAIGTMQRIRALGVDMSIDDFGTGYSSLAHLKRCPIQMLKIDRSFVNDVMTDPSDAAITEAITALAHKMGIEVIAEGVETQAQLDALRRYGCDAIQGYWLSKPLPADLLPGFLARIGHAAGAPRSDIP